MRCAQAQMTFERSRPSNFVGPPAAVMIAWVLWDSVPAPWLVVWVLAMCVVMFWRLALIQRNQHDGPSRSAHWIKHYELALFVNGALYGMLATVLLPREPAALSMAMVATVIAVSSVGVVVLSADQRSALAFTAPVILPGALWQLALFEGKVAMYVALGMFLFLALMVVEVRRAGEHTRNMLRLRFQMDELAEQRHVALQLAERSNAAKGQFLATMSHEVRTPLHGILGLTRLLQADLTEADAGNNAQRRSHSTERLRIIERSGLHLLAIINDVLDHSRIEGGQLHLFAEPFDLVALVGEVVDLQRAAAEEKRLYISWMAAMPAPRWVHGDVARLRQVLLNLLSNAVKFTERGGVELRLTHSAAGRAEVEITDSGPGVPAADRERIFEPFEQLDGSFARRHGGTGLGLAISRQLARAMQGNIECGASATGGACFRLWLVLRPCAPEEVPPAAKTAAAPNGALSGTVLLVEDNAVNAIVAEASLERLGLAVTTVGDGHAAVAACAAQRFDIVLMDCQLPGLDGFEASRQIRAEEQRRGAAPMRIVALTANALAGDRERCLAAGMNDHLAKPFTGEDLRSVLVRHLAQVSA